MYLCELPPARTKMANDNDNERDREPRAGDSGEERFMSRDQWIARALAAAARRSARAEDSDETND